MQLSDSNSVSEGSAIPLLEAREIGRRKSDNEWLFNELSLTVRSGESVSLTGATGVGKTVFLRSLCLLDPLDAGDVRWRGEPVAADAVPEFRCKMIYLHQQPALFPGTVEENLRLPFELQAHKDKQFDLECTRRMLDRIGRDSAFIEKKEANLSGGERQLVCFLRGMQLDPDMLLLDEPTSALDPETTGLAEQLLKDWHAEDRSRRSYLWVTHDPDQAARMADRHMRMTGTDLVEDKN